MGKYHVIVPPNEVCVWACTHQHSKKSHSHHFPGLCALPSQLCTETLRLWLPVHHSKIKTSRGWSQLTPFSTWGPKAHRKLSSKLLQGLWSHETASAAYGIYCAVHPYSPGPGAGAPGSLVPGRRQLRPGRELDKFSVSEAFPRRGQRNPQPKCPSSRAGLDKEAELGAT